MPTACTKILVVEDDAALRELVVDELAAVDYRVEAAADGRAALELIAQSPPDLILSDIRMPRVDGFELLATTRARFPALAATPFIFLSALADRREVLEGLGAGAEDYITKPIDFELLLMKVRSRVREAERRRRRAAGPQPASAAPARTTRTSDPSGRRTATLSLDRIRARLDTADPARGDQLRYVAEHVLHRRLAPADVVHCDDAGDYEVQFDTADPTEARARIAELERAIETWLFGEAAEVATSSPDAVVPAAFVEKAAARPAVVPPATVADQLAVALDEALSGDVADARDRLDRLAREAVLRAVSPRDGAGATSRLRYVRLDPRHEADLDALRRSGRLSEADAAQVEAIILYRFLVATDPALTAPDPLYVLPVSRHLLTVTPLFAIAKRVLAGGLATRRDRLVLSLPASFHRCRSLQTRLQELTRCSHGVSVRADDDQATYACLDDPQVRVVEFDTATVDHDGGWRRPGLRALIADARARRRVVVATGVPAGDRASHSEVFGAGVHLVCGA